MVLFAGDLVFCGRLGIGEFIHVIQWVLNTCDD